MHPMASNTVVRILLFVTLMLLPVSVAAEVWRSDWGPVTVKADGATFVGRYNNAMGGIVVMQHRGSGNYSGYWARACTSKKRYQIPAPLFSAEGSCRERRKNAYGKMTNCWGLISGAVHSSNTRFQGTFMTCNGKRLGQWRGWR